MTTNIQPCPTCARLLHEKVKIDVCLGDGKCRRCPLRDCRCLHTDPCDKGWIEDAHPVPSYGIALRRCPQCAEASFNARSAA